MSQGGLQIGLRLPGDLLNRPAIILAVLLAVARPYPFVLEYCELPRVVHVVLSKEADMTKQLLRTALLLFRQSRMHQVELPLPPVEGSTPRMRIIQPSVGAAALPQLGGGA